jgi:hypothetical protein
MFRSRFAQQDFHVHKDAWWNTKTLKVTCFELSCIFKSLEKLLLMLWLSLWFSSCKLIVKEIMKKKNFKFVFEFFMSNVWWSALKEHIQRFQLKFFPPLGPNRAIYMVVALLGRLSLWNSWMKTKIVYMAIGLKYNISWL